MGRGEVKWMRKPRYVGEKWRKWTRGNSDSKNAILKKVQCGKANKHMGAQY